MIKFVRLSVIVRRMIRGVGRTGSVKERVEEVRTCPGEECV